MEMFKKLFKKSFSQQSKIENISIQRLAPKCNDWQIDTLFITTRKSCPVCNQYNRKIYSLYGWNKKYPKIPDILLKEKCPNCSGSIGASIYTPNINSPIK